MERKDLLVAVGVTAVVSLGWYQFVWQSQGATESKATKAVQAADESASKLKTQVSSLQRLKTDLATKSSLKDQLDKAIPAQADLSAIVKQIQAMATQHEVTLTMITNGGLNVPASEVVATTTATTAEGAKSGTGPAPTAAATAAAPSGPATEMLLTLAMNGDYQKILSFVNDLGALPRLVVVDSMTMNPAQSAQVPGKAVAAGTAISATVAARVFTTVRPAPPSTPGSPAAAPPTTTTAGATGATTTTATKGGL